MHTAESSRRGLKLLCLGCAALLPPTLAAFAVNLELGLRVFFPGAVWLEAHLPAAWFQRLAFFAIDLSTVSTAVPVLMLAFPLVQGLRALRRPPGDHAWLRNLAADPYPPHFAFFLVMLGLVGTLHGMWIGLRTSGVAEIAGGLPSTETIQTTLDRLMGGTATAILSSLVGIIAAFFVAKPIPWLFRRLIGLQQEEGRQTLSETLEHLTRDLQGLSEASRGFAALLGPDAAQALAGRLERLETGLRALEAQGGQQVAALQVLEKGQAAGVAELQRLSAIEASVREQAARAEAATQLLQHIADGQARSTAALEAFVAAAGEQQRALAAHLAELASLARGQAEEARTERGALKRALSEFVK